MGFLSSIGSSISSINRLSSFQTDYDSTEAYIICLQKEVQLTDKEKEKLYKTDYRKSAAGASRGNTQIRRSQDSDNTAEGLTDLARLNAMLQPSEYVVYARHLRSAGLSMNDFFRYLHHSSKDVSLDKKVRDAIAGAMREIDPNISESDIERKLSKLKVED